MKNAVISTGSYIALFAVVFGFTSLVQTQVITMDRVGFNLLFLIVVTSFLIYLSREYLKGINYVKTGLIMGGALLVHGVVVFLILNYLEQPTWPFKSDGASFLLVNGHFSWVKPFDVFQQQLLILLLVLKLKDLGFSYLRTAQIFVVGFGAIHAFQVLKTDFIVGLTFLAGALILSYVLPWMFLKKENGLAYNFLIHLGLYDLMALLARVLY